MNAIALQKRLLKQIAEIDDVLVLKKIDQIVKASPKVYVLDEYQQEQIRISTEQVKNGEFFTSQEMDKMVEEWAREQ